MFPAHGYLEGAEVGDLGGGACDHECRGGAQAHAVGEPALEERYGPAAAGVEGDADRRRHQDAPGFISAKDGGHDILRYIALEEGGEEDAEDKIQAGRPDVSPEVQEIADEKIGVGIAAGTYFEPVKTEEFFFSVKKMHKQAGCAAAQKAGDDADSKGSRAQGGAVNDELGIEEDGGHHKGREPVLAHPLSAKGGGNRDRAVHTERRGDPQKAGRQNAGKPQSFFLHPCKEPVYFVLREYGDQGTDRHAQDPVPQDLPELEIKVVPDIHELSAKNNKQITHRY